MLTTNPVVWTVVNSAYDQSAQVLAIIWQGVTTAGDTVTLEYQGVKSGVLWTGRANDTQTYLGLNLGEAGLAAPGGFIVTQISSGTILVYLREE